jgi:hypothetical protein
MTPSISVRGEYNDNIFLRRTNREYDFITIITPAIKLRYAIYSLDFSLDYGLNFRFYSRYSKLNDTNISEAQTIKFQTQLRHLDRFFIDVTDVYERVPVDIRRPVALENVFVNMTDSNKFLVSPYIKLPLTSTLSTTFGYSYNNIWYRAVEAIDSESHSAFLGFNNQFSPRLNGRIKYSYFAYRPDNINDYDRHQGSIAITYQVTPALRVSGGVGKAKFDYKTTEDITTTFWNINSEYYVLELPENPTLSASYGSFFHDSVIAGVYKSRRFDLRFKTGEAFELTIHPYHSTAEYFETDRKDKVTGVAVDISRPLTKRISASLFTLWEKQKFLPQDEEVSRYSLRSTLEYGLTQNITAIIGYTYNSKNSNIDVNDFHNNVIWVEARLTF